MDNNLSLGFSHGDMSFSFSELNFAIDGILSKIGRFFDKFERELGRISRIDAVDLEDTIFEEMKFKGCISSRCMDIHGEDIVLNLDRLRSHRSMAVQSSMTLDLIEFMHNPISWDIDIDSIEKLACEIIFRVFVGAVMITDFIDLNIRRSVRDDGMNGFSDAHIDGGEVKRRGCFVIIINII